MRVVFRADASDVVGQGHVRRCLTLAGMLASRGTAVTFVSREREGHLCDLIEARGFSVTRLSARVDGERQEQPEATDASWSADADDTRAAIGREGSRADWLVVDSYALGRPWEERVRVAVKRIMVIDDLADRPHDCDLLLDQNLVAGMKSRYNAHLSPTCERLLGPTYALLEPDYADLHNRSRVRSGPVRRVLVFFGGADNANVTGRVVSALLALRCTDCALDVVAVANHPHRRMIQRQLAGHRNCVLHGNLPGLAPLMAAADLAVGGGGVTSWERLCLGLPSAVITLAQNQEAVGEELHRRGLARLLGKSTTITDGEIQMCLHDLISTPLDPAWSERCIRAVDGLGAKRVADRLFDV